MSVSQVIPASVGISGGVQGITPDDVSATISSSYIVHCSSTSDTPDIVLRYFRDHAGLPWMGRNFHLGNGFVNDVFCNDVKADRIDQSSGSYKVSCQFASLNIQGQTAEKPTVDGQQTKDPYGWHDEIEFSFMNISKVAAAGIYRGSITTQGPTTGPNFFQLDALRAITNSAGVPFDPPVERDQAIVILRITKNFFQSNATNAGGFINCVNNDFFVINKPRYNFRYAVAPYCAKIKQYSSVFAVDNGIPYWRETVEVHLNNETWRKFLLDIGFHRRVAYGDLDDTGTIIRGEALQPTWVPYTPITAKDGSALTAPVPLNGNGQQLILGRPHVYLVYSIDNEIPFSGFNWGG